MWQYFGNKGQLAHLYPRPKFSRVIEPFAGTARYSLLYFDRDVTLIDRYKVVVRIWRWLQKCSPWDVLKLPRMKFGESVDQYSFDCEEARWLTGFLIAGSNPAPKRSATALVSFRPNKVNFQLESIAKSLFKVRHWSIVLGDYLSAGNMEATWFIDPPYQVNGGDGYVANNSGLDYVGLGEWCRSRKGQVVACETMNADWLPFKRLKRVSSGMRGTSRVEAIWLNLSTDYDAQQLKILGMEDFGG